VERDDLPVVRALPLFDSFYASEFEAVAGLAYALSGSRLAAEDLAQDAFLAAYRRWDVIGRYDNPGGWVRRAVAKRSVSAVRRRVTEAKALPKLAASPDLLPELSPEAADVWRAVRRLPKRQAQVVALFYLEDLSLDDVADTLDVAVETVRTHLSRARKKLAIEESNEES
jgi:RNA polymerase sigma-70 factor (ECF subfamily)